MKTLSIFTCNLTTTFFNTVRIPNNISFVLSYHNRLITCDICSYADDSSTYITLYMLLETNVLNITEDDKSVKRRKNKHMYNNVTKSC